MKCHARNCERAALSRLIVCFDHATKDALWLLTQSLQSEIDDLLAIAVESVTEG